MKKAILVLVLFIFMMSCLSADISNTKTNTVKPLTESIYTPVNAKPQTSLPTTPDRQNILAVDFTGLTALPTGWTIDAAASHWAVRQTNAAGGTVPELRFDWSPTYNGFSRFISPVVDLTGLSSINLEFQHSVDHYTTPYTVGVATRTNNGTWNPVWTLNPTDMVAPELKELVISNSDVGSATFQICFYFSGNTYNINDWYIDNIRLYTPWPNDVKVKAIDTNVTYSAGEGFVPPVVIANVGTNSATFDVNCQIKEYNTIVYDHSITMYVAHGAEANANFPIFTPATVNETYKIEVTTYLTGDQDTSNDFKIKYFNTFATERQKVVLEIGTGTWCTYCPGAAMGADDLVTNGKEVAVVEYHNGDTYTNDNSNARNTYYNITGFPTAFFDGQASYVGGNHTISNYPAYLPMYEDALAFMSPFYISMVGALEGTNLYTYVDVKRFARITDDPLVLHFAVIENGIQFAWQGQTHLEFVERAMTPDYNGTPLNDLIDEEAQTVLLNTTINSAWNTPNLELVAFVQNPLTKVIYQGFVIPLIDLSLQYTTAQPTNLAAQQAGNIVHLSWTPPTVTNGLSGYMIYRDDSLIFVKTRVGANEYDDVAIAGNRTYTVKALYGPSMSDPSNMAVCSVTANNDPTASPLVSCLLGSYPNPFSTSSSIRYEMVKDAKVSLAVYNIKGQLIRTLENGVKAVGTHEIVWDGTDNDGNKLASGVYIYRFNTGNVKQTLKAILLK